MNRRLIVAAIVFVTILSGVFFLGRHGLRFGGVGTVPSSPSAQDELACAEGLPDSVKIGQKLMAAGYKAQLYEETHVFARYDIGGLIVMDAVPAAGLASFRHVVRIAPIVAVDQEGGTVQRYTNEGRLPGAEDMAKSATPDQAFVRYRTDDAYLKSLGITTNFAPVVDVASRTPNPLPGRMYSADKAVVTRYATAAVKAADGAGVTPVVKHFPGLGSATGNTDFAPAMTDPLAVLKRRDLLPYQQLARYHPDVMVGSVIVPGLTDGQPAVWSSRAVSLLRSLGYQDAVVYSDSLTAKAVPGELEDSVLKAWQAGIDVALIVQTREQTPQLASDFEAISTHASAALKSGRLDKTHFAQSVERILARKHINACTLKAQLSARR